MWTCDHKHFWEICYEDKQTRGACVLAGSRECVVFIFCECQLQKPGQAQAKLPEFSLPVPLLVNHFLSAATISIIRAWDFYLLQRASRCHRSFEF